MLVYFIYYFYFRSLRLNHTCNNRKLNSIIRGKGRRVSVGEGEGRRVSVGEGRRVSVGEGEGQGAQG